MSSGERIAKRRRRSRPLDLPAAISVVPPELLPCVLYLTVNSQ
jgi:hypothetical protein